ncbi:MAG: adenylate kinase [Clostridiales bacterium]|jgi:adenylate kinase family enzyme|nr:adenylate kinase [Clostridiales bacterium]
MKKVIVIGCPGSGKSTFSRRLRDKTGLPLFYLDMIWHKPDRSNVSRDVFDNRLNEILSKDKWIIDGNYLRTLPMRLEKCDTVFLLDFKLELCLSSAYSRIGKQREDLPWIEHTFDEEFKQWIMDFPKDQLPVIYDLLETYCNKTIIIFKNRSELEQYFVS